jgi:hypothetical protein
MQTAEARKKLLAGVLVALFGLLCAAAVAIYGYGIYIANVSNSATILQLCSLVPAIGQACLMWASWSHYGVFFNAYNIAVLGWFALAILFGNILMRR